VNRRVGYAAVQLLQYSRFYVSNLSYKIVGEALTPFSTVSSLVCFLSLRCMQSVTYSRPALAWIGAGISDSSTVEVMARLDKKYRLGIISMVNIDVFIFILYFLVLNLLE